MTITDEWRGAFQNTDLNALHAEGFGHVVRGDDWWTQVNRHSLGWVCARQESFFALYPASSPFARA